MRWQAFSLCNNVLPYYCPFSTTSSFSSAGCVLGLGLVLGALSGSGQTEHRARVGLTLDKLLEALQGDSSSQGRMLQEVHISLYLIHCYFTL